MSIVAAPTGAEPIGTLSSSGSSSQKRVGIPIAASYAVNIFYGDFVKRVAGGTVELDTGTTTLNPIGIFLGCDYTDPTVGQFRNSQYWPASNAADDAIAWVLMDPFVLFKMQGDEAITQADLGLNYPMIQTAGSTAIGRSKNALNAGSGGTTLSLPIKIVDFVDGPDSAVGDAFTDVICMFNPPHDPAATANGHQLLVSLGF